MAVALALALATFIGGCYTTVWDNDEAHHLRMAKGFYMAGERVPCIQSVTTKDIPWDQFYFTDVLWPLLLSKLWLLAGQSSHILAQLYQATWLFALLMGLYCLSRLYYDPWVSLLAVGLAISIPMVLVFGTLFFLDVPVMALTIWALYIAHKLGRWHWVFALGLLVGAIYLTKRLNVAFFPCIALIGFVTTREGWRKRLAKLMVAAIIAGGLIAVDLNYRSEHFDSLLVNKHEPLKAYSTNDHVSIVKDVATDIYISNSLFRWKDALMHIGLFFPLALVVYILGRDYQRRDMLFTGLAVFYTIAYVAFSVYFVSVTPAPRYYLPSAVLLTVPAAKGLKGLWRWRFGRIALLFCGILAIAQLTLVLREVHKRRQLPADTAEAYRFIRESLPDDGKVFLCNGYGLELHTGRVSTARSIEPYRFYQPNTSWETRSRVLDELNIGYIVYREDCIYDDRKTQVIWNASGGMPMSFFESLKRLTNYKLIFKNESVSIWKVVSFNLTGDRVLVPR